LFLNPKVPKADSLAAVEKTALRFPSDPLAHYDVGRRYRDLGRIADMERAFDRCIALAPIAGALAWKAHFALWHRGDLAETKALIDRVPARTRAGERVVLMRWAYAMVSGQTADALEGLDALTAKWVEDFNFNGPKSLLVAQLLEGVGKRELARLQYESALIEVRARQARAPTNVTLRETEAWILHGLGRDEEARPLSRLALEALPRPYRYGALLDWWFTSVPRCLLTGDREIAVQLLREAATAESRAPLRMNFKLDPRMAAFRDDPEIMALIAEPIK
jgi:tetratricopeptide (TPR) repeat protein